MNDYENLKKKYGEKFARFCRSVFPTILEEEGKLSKIIEANFAPSKFLYDDICQNEQEYAFIKFIKQKANIEPEIVETDLSPEELLDKAGYTLFKCETVGDILSFEKYYAYKEAICTFNNPKQRLKEWEVFFAVKKNVHEIKRENFAVPRRQDEYGTSVISIQFYKDDGEVSIKNRYNHAVQNPDATFSNNLENIIPGLTHSFRKYYNASIKNREEAFRPDNYITINNKYTRFVYMDGDARAICYNNIFCNVNNIYHYGKIIKQYDKNIYETIDYFLVDKQTGEVTQLLWKECDNCLKNIIGNSKKIDIVKLNNGERLFTFTNQQGQQTEIVIDILNRIVEFKNDYIEEIGDNFLSENKVLRKFEAKNLKKVGNNFLEDNLCLQELNLPKLEKVGNCFLMNNSILKKLTLPELKITDGGFLQYNEGLETLSLPNLQSLGSFSFESNKKLKNIELPKLKYISYYSFYNVEKVDNLFIPSLELMETNCFRGTQEINNLYAEKLVAIEVLALKNLKEINKINAPNLILTNNVPNCIKEKLNEQTI